MSKQFETWYLNDIDKSAVFTKLDEKYIDNTIEIAYKAYERATINADKLYFNLWMKSWETEYPYEEQYENMMTHIPMRDILEELNQNIAGRDEI